MIIARLFGGLGNQMFEYAMCLSLAREQNTGFKINLRSFVKTRIPYGLDHFSITAKKASALEILLVKKLDPKHYFDEFYWLDFDHWQDWMCEKSFKKFENVIRDEFTLKKELMEELDPLVVKEITENNSVAIHIRRTDYFNKKNCIVLDPQYYDKALDIIAQKVENPKYFFFSDDMEWTKNHFASLPNSFFLSNKDYEDMILMSLCKHNIISNSTFAWWGAWLNKNPDKIVTTPAKWFVESHGVEQTLNLKNWTVL